MKITQLVLIALSILPSPCRSLTAAEPAASVLMVEEHMQSIIESQSPAVVGIVVSQAKYPPLPAQERNIPGRLGSYTPVFNVRPAFFPRIPMIDPRDLSNPSNLGNHQFGTGIVLDAQRGLILTTHHLVDGATKVYIRSSLGAGSYADIKGADARSDLAVLQLIDRIEGLKPAKLGTVRFVADTQGRKPNVKRGSFILALGHPLAAGFVDGQPSASWGIVSNIRRRAASEGDREEVRPKPLHQYASLIQTDARITLGSSGSAVLNLSGEVIGIASNVAAVTGAENSGGFVIPFDANYRRIISVLQTGKEVEYGFLGVGPLSDRSQVTVGTVTPGCPAALAGLREGDTLVSVDGQKLSDWDDMLLYLGGALAGTEVNLKVRRAGRDLDVAVVLAKNANPLPAIVTSPAPSYQGLSVDYSSIRMLQLFNARNPLRAIPPQGVAVRELEPNSPAEKEFQNAGEGVSNWLITQVDGVAVTNPSEFYKAMNGKARAKLTLVDPTNPNRSVVVALP